MERVGVGELMLVLLTLVPMLVVPALFAWLVWRAVKALESIAEGLRRIR